ncbi:hypothetical protein GGQ85_001000 [Nitrobacter vulgaris]|nr:hypothetical protein [Nitrobacter vulgaris]
MEGSCPRKTAVHVKVVLKTYIGNHRLHSETKMLNYGYDTQSGARPSRTEWISSLGDQASRAAEGKWGVSV